MVTRGAFYGTAAVLVALLLLSVTAAGVFYGMYSQSSAQNKARSQELDSALARYNSLSGLYNASLADDNRTLFLLATAVANLNTSTPAYQNASSELASLWSSYQRLASARGGLLSYEVHMLVDYGNGTKVWYNDTEIQPGWNGYVVTLVLLNGSVDAAWYPQYGEHFVTGIGGVGSSRSESWFLFAYGQRSGWTASQVGVDALQITNGTAFAWALCPETADYAPACAVP